MHRAVPSASNINVDPVASFFGDSLAMPNLELSV